MPTTLPTWTENDTCLALDEVLSDPWLTPPRREEIMRSVVRLCMVSPNAFRRLWAYEKQPLLAGELARRAFDASYSHPKGAAFRAWFDATPSLKNRASTQTLPLLTKSQQAAWQELEETAALYFSGALKNARIQPRTSRLIAGPTGVGKTHLLRSFAREKGLGFLSLTYGEWMPSGAKTDTPTAEKVLKFIAAYERCLIAVDELDKVHVGLRQEWSVSILNDLYALLDRTWFQGRSSEIKDTIQRKFRDNVFIVGAGTWQALWVVKGGAQASIGFQKTQAAAMPDQIRAAQVVPTELLNRFHPEILLLEPLTASDFEGLCRAENLDAQASDLGLPLDYHEAAASGLGVRWLEALTLKIHLVRARRLTAPETLVMAPATNLASTRITPL